MKYIVLTVLCFCLLASTGLAQQCRNGVCYAPSQPLFQPQSRTAQVQVLRPSRSSQVSQKFVGRLRQRATGVVRLLRR